PLNGTGPSLFGPFSLPAAGTYTLTLEATRASDTGSAELALTAVEPLTAGGPSATAKVAVPGQLATFAITGSEGEPFEVSASEGTFPSDYQTQLVAATGLGDIVSDVAYLNGEGPYRLPRFTLPASGNYDLTVAPGEGDTGEAELALTAIHDEQGTIATKGSPLTATLTGAGQQNRYSFSGKPGTVLSVELTDDTIPESGSSLSLLGPSGPVAGPYFLFGGDEPVYLRLPPLPEKGEYQLELSAYPFGGTGSVTIQLAKLHDHTGKAKLGKVVSAAIRHPEELSTYTLSVPGAEKLSTSFTQSTFPSGENDTLSLESPAGAVVDSTYVNSASGDFETSVPEGGTYKLVLGATNSGDVGSLKFKVQPVPEPPATGTDAGARAPAIRTAAEATLAKLRSLRPRNPLASADDAPRARDRAREAAEGSDYSYEVSEETTEIGHLGGEVSYILGFADLGTRSNGQTRVTFQKQEEEAPTATGDTHYAFYEWLFHDLCITSSTSTTNADASGSGPSEGGEVQTEKLEDGATRYRILPGAIRLHGSSYSNGYSHLTGGCGPGSVVSEHSSSAKIEPTVGGPTIEGTLPAGVSSASGTRDCGSSSYFREVFGLIQSGVTTCKVSFRLEEGPKYVALGDSYSAGTGTGLFLEGEENENCYRSPAAYPELIAAEKRYKLSFQACNGATTGDVKAAQLQALSAATRLVTISIGGNDVNFGGILEACVKAQFLGNEEACVNAISKGEEFAKKVLPNRLMQQYAEIRSKAPNATVIVLGYPKLFQKDGRTCKPYEPSESAAKQLNKAAVLLDSVISTQAKAAGFSFVNPTAPFEAHELCSAEPWLNGLEGLIIEQLKAESYHPDREGQTEFARLIANAP
ncbi:MAG TPA: SGNH/GDSL hydrolase family protein, partial [Solirubrobacteraceae bacterium]|nr:SGNH/GDSL hydrolase family protein [Solirubrobacteraceae bacterium]